MSFSRNNPLTIESFSVDVPLNTSSPIRIALLGSEKTGKTSIVSKLDQGIYTDTYYPTNRVNTSMFTYIPQRDYTKALLNGTGDFECPSNVVLSPVLQKMKKGLLKRGKTAVDSEGSEVMVYNRTDYYRSYSYKEQKKQMPEVTPILVELIDTPAYKSDFIPFLETSLYTNLEKDVLKNLANEPRRHVSTMPLLVASGAGELNGFVDGYFYVYSAIPSYNPPTYHNHDKPHDSDDNSLNVLRKIKASIDEAWKEFYTYKVKWEEGKEADIYSFKDALKNLMSNKNIDEIETKKLGKRKFYKQLLDYPTDPADVSSPPPIWIVCTHTKSHLASHQLIEEGESLAKKWGCGYVAIDIDENVEVVLALIIREISERKRLQRIRQLNSK